MFMQTLLCVQVMGEELATHNHLLDGMDDKAAGAQQKLRATHNAVKNRI
jgi:hypothetical protein